MNSAHADKFCVTLVSFFLKKNFISLNSIHAGKVCAGKFFFYKKNIISVCTVYTDKFCKKIFLK